MDGATGNPFDLTGTGAVVTGGNGGIGLGIAMGLAVAGAAVAVWGTNQEKNAAAVAEIEAAGGRVVGLRCDITDETQVGEAFARSVEFCGGVDSCFANAGLLVSGTPFLDMSLAEWQRVLAVNLDGTFLVLQAAARHMAGRGGGSLVVTSSVSALKGHPQSEHYATAKAGQLALVRSLAVELARHHIRVNAVLPGYVETALAQPLLSSPAFEKHVIPSIPQRRMGTPEEFAGICVYLASKASSYHTGDAIVIDGGYAIR